MKSSCYGFMSDFCTNLNNGRVAYPFLTLLQVCLDLFAAESLVG